MGILNIVQKIKETHTTDIVFMEVGSFYYLYGRDAYIISYLFGYNLKKVENIYTCGFPKSGLNKIISILENKKINYISVDRQNNYEIKIQFDNKNLNRYNDFYEKSKKYINIKNRINNINQYLNKNINQKNIEYLLCEMENIINKNENNT